MPRGSRRLLRSPIYYLGAVGLLTVMSAGCTLWPGTRQAKSNSADEQMTWPETRLRQLTPRGQMTGLSSQAREIERQLGVQ